MKCVILFATPQVDTITLFMDEDLKVGRRNRTFGYARHRRSSLHCCWDEHHVRAVLSLGHVTATSKVVYKDYLLELSQPSGVGQILITISQVSK